MNGKSRVWTRKVDCSAGRRQALRDALVELPSGVTWDLVIRHHDGCDTLEEWSDGRLTYCTCKTLLLEARELIHPITKANI